MACILAPQAVNCPSFVPPPLDQPLTFPCIYDFHLSTNPNHPLFRYASDAGAIRQLTWKQVVTAIHKVAKMVASLQGIGTPYQDKPPVIAILAVSDQLSYFTVTAGIIRAGFCAFPISPRNSGAAIANLLRKTNASFLFVSKDHAMQNIATLACDTWEQPTAVKFLDMPSFEQLYHNQEAFVALPPLQKSDVDETALILHSSGSTSFPKPILLSHRNLWQWGSQPYYGEVDICGKVLSNHSLPFFHAMGVVSLCWATMTGLVLSNFAPKDVPQMATSDVVFSNAIATGCNLIFCVPAFLEEWAQSSEKVGELRKFNAVLFGGAPIHSAVGDMLIGEGVKLYPFYGATELGGTSQFLLKSPPREGWEYFKISPHTKAKFLSERQDSHIHRLVVQDSPSHSPAKFSIRISDLEAYDTNDLMIHHPLNKDLWKIYGRADDQIMHSSGEKTNPVPMETIIQRHPGVAGCIIFGRGRFQTGILLEPAENPMHPSSNQHITAFLDDIWPSIEEANNFAPSHSRIFRELLLMADPAKPFLYTAKGTVRRQIILDLYEREINHLYAAMDEVQQRTTLQVLGSFSSQECLAFVRMTIRNVLKQAAQVSDEDDLFQHGCDSLQANWIRNHVLSALPQQLAAAGTWTETVPRNLVYSYPTIRRLSDYMFKIISQGYHDDDDDDGKNCATIKEMELMVERYAHNFPKRDPLGFVLTEETVFLTGSTGGLGSYLLESLLLNREISRVYALNRANKISTISQRQLNAFRDRGIDVNLLNSPKLLFLEGDLLLDNFGLSQEVYDELKRSVTCIMHIAWHVDFNLRLSSMEPLISGTRRLVDFALTCTSSMPPQFIFASSIGVVRYSTDRLVPEAPILDAAAALGSGYPESKWVAERILTRVKEVTCLSPVIVRIGQLSGGRNGSWNPVEWVPSIVRSGEFLHCLPLTSGWVSWIPASTAATALIEMRHSRHTFLHLVHPSPVRWDDIVQVMSRVLQIPLVSYQEWIATLENCEGRSDAAKSNPAFLLLSFYQSANQSSPAVEDEAFGFPRLATVLACETSQSLRPPYIKSLGNEDVEAWIAYWRGLGALGRAGDPAHSEGSE